MPLEKLVLILVVVAAAAGATIWIGAALMTGFSINPMVGIGVLSILTLAAYLVFRVVSERLNSPDDDHYDNMEN